MKKTLLFISLICCCICNTTAQQFTSNLGTDFWVAYGHHQYFEAESINSQNMTIYVSVQDLPVGVSFANITIEVDSSDANYNNWFRRIYKIPANTVISIDDSNSVKYLQSYSPVCANNYGPIPKGTTNSVGCGDYRILDPLPPVGTGGEKVFSNKGIHIKSDFPIVAYAHIYGSANSGATMLIPTNSWGTSYKTINSRQATASAAYSFFYIIAKEDNTPVRIIPSKPSRMGKPAFVPIDITLNKGQVYQYVGQVDKYGDGVELTGSSIQSLNPSKAIAVFAGSSRTAGEFATGVTPSSRDNDMQQCFPVETWGKEFLTSPFATASTSAAIYPSHKAVTVYKIIGRDSNTHVTINNGTPFLLNDSFYKFDDTVANKIVADKPIMVAQFMVVTNGENGLGDPEMIYLSPVERGINQTGFYRHVKENIGVNYVNIIVPTDALNTLTIDSIGYPFGTYSTTYLHPQDSNYTVVVKGWKSLRKQCLIKCDKRFVGITYGLGSVESYGYNIGANFYLNTPNTNPFAKPLIYGYVFCDANNNGVKDANEIYKANVKVDLSNGLYTFSNNNGYYEIEADSTGTYTFNAYSPNGYTALPSTIVFNFLKKDTVVRQDIALQADSLFEDFNINVTPIASHAIAGGIYPYLVEYFNTGTATINPEIDVLYNNYILSYDSCTDSSVVAWPNGIVTQVNNFKPGERRDFIAYHTISSSANVGDSIITNYNMHTASKTVAGNFYNLIESNAAFSISCRQAISPAQITKGEGIDYTIQFTNDRTYTINNVKITDTFNTLLLSNSVQILGSSHLCKATVKGNTILFELNKANLSPATKNKGYGYIKFRIKPAGNLKVGTIIYNKATVYFDFDNAVSTNLGRTIINETGKYKPNEILYYTVNLNRSSNEAINKWQLILEENVAKYVIERSINNKDFSTVKEITTVGLSDYTYADNISLLIDKTNKIYYRLKIIDKKGKITYSDVKIVVLRNIGSGFIIYPNPATTMFMVDCADTKTIEVYDCLGKLVVWNNVSGDLNKVDIKTLSKSNYLVRVITQKDEVFINKLVVQ